MPDELGARSGEAASGDFGTVTIRSVFLGLISVVFMCFHANYEMHVTGTSVMTLSNFPICALEILVLWLMLNALWRAASPRTALRPMEMLTIMVMAWAAGMMPARGWSGRLVGLLCAPKVYATPENRWDDIFRGARGILTEGSFLPRWVFPNPDSNAAQWFYNGLPSSTTPIPWYAWATPVFWWTTAALAMGAVAICISIIFHRQWATYERLSFPLASVPVALVTVRPGERVSPILKNRLFWVGVLLSGGVLCWNIVGYFFSGWPRITIYRTAYEISQTVLTGFPDVSFRVYPPVIGFLYLANLDLLLSLWLFWLCGWLATGTADTLGIAVGEYGKKLTGSQMVTTSNYGAIVFLVIWSVWVARRHLAAVWRAALGRDRGADNPGGPMTYRTALVVLVLGLLYLGLFGWKLGMALGVIIPALLLILVAFFITAKYMAATGMPYITAQGFGNGQLLTNIAGNSWMSAQSGLGLGLMHSGAFGAEARLFGLGMMPHALRIGEYVPRRGSRLLAAVALALIVGAGFSIWHTAWLGYHRAGLRMDNFTIRTNPEQEVGRIARTVDDIQHGKALPFDWSKFWVWAAGFIGAGACTMLQARIGWWPLHPVGLAFSGAAACTNYWLSIFIVWLTKLIILKIGGVRLYEKAKPLFIGLIVGYVFGLMVSYTVDSTAFYGQGGHGIEDW